MGPNNLAEENKGIINHNAVPNSGIAVHNRASNSDNNGWFSRIRNSFIVRTARLFTSMVTTLYGEFFNGRSERFYLASAVLGGFLIFFASISIILVLMAHFRVFTPEQNFVWLENHSIRLVADAFVSNRGLEGCLNKCKKTSNCVTVLFDPENGEKRCAWFAYSPFYLDLQPVKKGGATIYIHRRALLSGEMLEDGNYYWLTHVPFPASKVEKQCELNSDFYSLAIESRTVRRILVAKVIPKLRKHGGPYDRVILWRVHKVGQNMSSIVKTLVRFGDTVEYIGPNSKGYGFCQGDPFNRRGHAPLKRRGIYEPETIFRDL